MKFKFLASTLVLHHTCDSFLQQRVHNSAATYDTFYAVCQLCRCILHMHTGFFCSYMPHAHFCQLCRCILHMHTGQHCGCILYMQSAYSANVVYNTSAIRGYILGVPPFSLGYRYTEPHLISRVPTFLCNSMLLVSFYQCITLMKFYAG